MVCFGSSNSTRWQYVIFNVCCIIFECVFGCCSCNSLFQHVLDTLDSVDIVDACSSDISPVSGTFTIRNIVLLLTT